MQRFFSNRRLVITIVAVILSVGLMSASVALRNRRNTPPLVQQFGNDIVGLVDRVVTVPANAVGHTFGSISDLMNTYQENQQLKSQVAELAQTKVRDQALAKENAQLKQQVKLNHSLTDYRTITASVMTRTPSSWQNQVIINKGQSAGITKDMPVMSGSGLVGRISEVNKTNSKVELITDNNNESNRFAIQVTNGSGDTVNGLVTSYDKANNQLVMGNITSNTKLKAGDKVVTSGLGGITPKGLYVGKIAKVSSDDYGLSKKIIITPAASFNDLNIVTVAARAE